LTDKVLYDSIVNCIGIFKNKVIMQPWRQFLGDQRHDITRWIWTDQRGY